MPYRILNADRIEATLETLYHRIQERFPNRGLANLCKQLLEIAREDKRKLSWVAKPILWLRIGVGAKPPEYDDLADWVLGRFSKAERSAVLAEFDRMADAVECWLAEGIEKAMTKFNTKA